MTLEELKRKSEQKTYIIENGEIRESLGYSADICTGDKVMDLDNLVAIPDNATNGDIIKIMFPDVVNSNMDLTEAFKKAKERWNAPYKYKSGVAACKYAPCEEDAISRQAALDLAITIETDDHNGNEIMEVVDINDVKALPPVQPKMGHWIYNNFNWWCSECHETPKTMGYVGTAEFMKEHFKFCNHCGARMIDVTDINDGKLSGI